MPHQRWRLQIVEAEITHDTELVAKMDPYVKIFNDDQIWRSTTAKKGGKNPKWKHQRMKIPNESDFS